MPVKRAFNVLVRNWKTLLILALMAPPVFLCIIIPIAIKSLSEFHPERITAFEKYPEVLQESFQEDPTLLEACEIWQIYPLPDRKCIWVVTENAEYVEQFIQGTKLTSAQFSHPKVKLLLGCVRPNWEVPDANSWDWFSTAKYGEEFLEGQDLFLVAWKKDRSVAIVFYEWNF